MSCLRIILHLNITLQKDGRTALMTAAFLGHTAVAATLLKRGAKVSHVDEVRRPL
jgi:ankyrin repeat protein